MTLFTDPAFVVAGRMLLALIFLSAAVGKMRHWSVLEGVIANYRLLPRSWSAAIAYALPPAEALIGLCLLLGLVLPWAGLAAAGLLGAFALAMAINLLRGRAHIDCGCFQGALRQSLCWPLVARNALLLLLALLTARSSAMAAQAWDMLNGIMASIALYLTLQTLNALWAVQPAWRKTLPTATPAGAIG